MWWWLLAAWAVDLDQDGFEPPMDCDDQDQSIHPAAVDVCDLLDNNCNHMADEPSLELTDHLDPLCVWHHPDQDADGWGAAVAGGDYCLCPYANRLYLDGGTWQVTEERRDCLWTDDQGVQRYGLRIGGICYLGSDSDCDDLYFRVHPSVTGDEVTDMVANGVDEDCDGFEPCHTDLDGDGHPGAGLAPGPLGCVGEGFGAAEEDCDDSQAGVAPGAAEVCGDAIDQDCDGGDLSCPPSDEAPPPADDEDPQDDGPEGGCGGWGGAYATLLLLLPAGRRRPLG